MIKGKFIEECKHRFLAKVIINGKEEECYMPTSSKLSKIINLANQEVYLIENMGKSLRTKYKVHSVRIKNNLILLDLNCLNKLYFSEILLKDSKYLQERKINNLKIDFVNEEKNEIIEIKGLISDNSEIVFPHTNSKRIIRQLKNLGDLHSNIRFVFILMNPKINRIILDDTNKEFMKYFKSALDRKIELEIYKIYWKKNKEHLKKEEYEFEKNILKIK